MEYTDHSIDSIQAVCEPLIAAGNKIYFKWTCKGCGERAVANDPNVVHHWMNHQEKADGSPCGYVTDVKETGGNYILVSRKDKRDYVSMAYEPEEPLWVSPHPTEPGMVNVKVEKKYADGLVADGILFKKDDDTYSFEGQEATREFRAVGAKQAADWDNYFGYIWPKRSTPTDQCARCFKVVPPDEELELSLHLVRGERMIPICKACHIDEEFTMHVANKVLPPWDWPVMLEWDESEVWLELDGQERIPWKFRALLEAAVRWEQGRLDDPSVQAVIEKLGRDRAGEVLTELIKSEVWDPLRQKNIDFSSGRVTIAKTESP